MQACSDNLSTSDLHNIIGACNYNPLCVNQNITCTGNNDELCTYPSLCPGTNDVYACTPADCYIEIDDDVIVGYAGHLQLFGLFNESGNNTVYFNLSLTGPDDTTYWASVNWDFDIGDEFTAPILLFGVKFQSMNL